MGFVWIARRLDQFPSLPFPSLPCLLFRQSGPIVAHVVIAIATDSKDIKAIKS
jgi:hypothetical protein